MVGKIGLLPIAHSNSRKLSVGAVDIEGSTIALDCILKRRHLVGVALGSYAGKTPSKLIGSCQQLGNAISAQGGGSNQCQALLNFLCFIVADYSALNLPFNNFQLKLAFTRIKLFDGDDVSESGYCSNFKSDDYTVSLFSADESVDGTACDGAFAYGESFCDDLATFNHFWYMRETKTGCPNQAHSANERDQVLDSFDRSEGACKESDPIAIECRAFDFDDDDCQLTGSLPLAIDADDCEQSDDGSDAYAKYNMVFIDDQLLSHDEEASGQGSGQRVSMFRDLDIHDVGSSQTPSVDTFVDDEADWGFDLPVVEMDADMTSYVEKAFERLQILKSQREIDQACNHGILSTLFLSEFEGARSNKEETNV
ncbi:hypothetical protein L7F22_036225 [Adiantum nelumboides]|nr:hypothetical protein [Adiantum nelumboides]